MKWGIMYEIGERSSRKWKKDGIGIGRRME